MEETERYMKKLGMAGEGDVVVAGVSGGADSVCLLFVLCALRERMGFTVKACHVNHGLRGADADADERYVREICGRFQVECVVFHENVELIAGKRKQSLEEAGRMVRREAFEKVCAGEMHARIATAHHRDDNAETVLLNIARGTGLRGLCGIWPVRGRWIRPLLWAGRDEIEGFLREQGLGWCTDATNEADDYTRNRIRHHVIPSLEKQVNPGTAGHLNELSAQARELWELLEQETERAYRSCVRRGGDGGSILDKAALEEEQTAVKKQLVRRCIAEMLGTEKDISAVHVKNVLELLDRQNGRRVDLPGRVSAVRVYEGVEISRTGKAGPGRTGGMPDAAEETILEIPGETVLPDCGGEDKNCRITCRLVPRDSVREGKDIPQKKYTKWMDYDIIKHGLSVRGRRPGDYLEIDAGGNRQKLKSYFINEKIPREEREKLRLIADGPEIVWIPGHRLNPAYYVKDSTKRILEIKITEERTDVRDDQGIDPGRESR